MTTLPLRPECAPVETSSPMPGRTVLPTSEELSRCLGLLLEKVESRLLKQFPLCVVQEARDNAESAALIAICEGLAQGMTPSGWRKWLWVVARNAAVTLQRSKRPVPLPDDEAIVSPAAAWIDRHEQELALEAVQQLAPGDRAMVEAVYVEGLSVRAASQKTGIRYGCFRRRLPQAISRLRDAFQRLSREF
jgi:RNA polymerase sigma factor (sigma-70 family)